MRAKLARFMTGRNGSDSLCRFMSFVALAMIVIGIFSGTEAASVLWGLSLMLIVYTYFRILSRNLSRRQTENSRYLTLRRKLTLPFTDAYERWKQRKEFVFFRCPACRTMLRVPRGKGKLKIVCRKCGTSFVKKT